ncbi:MAG: hypothetical protein JW934_05845 [Anaerolineae bacterium]|nr:hypothetical protein [Anaerolineae bacterium]
MKTRKQIITVLINGALIVALVALLATYLVVVSDLPSRVYTEPQREFLEYNSMRSVVQAAPTWKYVQPQGIVSEGTVLAMTFPGQESLVRATLVARYEEQEGVSVTVYDLDFRGEYRLLHSGTFSTTVELFFPFPDNLETLHDVRFAVDGEEPSSALYSTRGIWWQATLLPDQDHALEISYKADGANSFAYGLAHDQRADVDISVSVVGLNGSSVPKGSLPASQSEPTVDGEKWTWHYDALIADRDIRLDLPARQSFAQRVSRLQDDFRTLAGLAPFLVVLFMAALGGVLNLDGVRLRLASYLLIGFGLALFYPLLTFLSGLVPLIAAAALSTLLVSGLLLIFLARAIGGRSILLRAGLLLIVFLGFLSLGVLTPWRGLLLTAGGLALAGMFMLLYARRAVAPEPEAKPDDEPAGEVASVENAAVLAGTVITASEPMSAPEPSPALEPSPASESAPAPGPARLHCPYCARSLEMDYAFCPGCGHDTAGLRRCAHCGHQQLIAREVETTYCVRCGERLD